MSSFLQSYRPGYSIRHMMTMVQRLSVSMSFLKPVDEPAKSRYLRVYKSRHKFIENPARV